MKRPNTSLDGFIPRRPRSQLGDLQHGESPDKPEYRPLHTGNTVGNNQVGRPRQGYELKGEIDDSYYKSITRNDISDSLNDIDDEPDKHKKRRKNRGDKLPKPPKPLWKRILRWVIVGLIVIILAAAGYFTYTVLHAGNNILNGNLIDIFTKNKPLLEDADGRSNFLIIGTSEDDPGHQGANLTDSIVVVSVDQDKKNAFMFSVPRDLYVKYGQACPAGYSGKINAYYSCVLAGNTADDEQDAQTAMRKFIGDIVGLDIQYSAHVNYSVVRDVVKAIGGSITVDIEGDGPVPAGVKPGSIMDSNFDWKCGATTSQRLKNCAPRGHFIDLAAGKQTLDAEHALYLAQARGDSRPTWGLVNSNFDREKNQQKIIMAIREKALSSGTLTNLGAVTSLISAMGNNLRTNVPTDEVKTILSLMTNINESDIQTINTYGGSDDPNIYTTGSPIEGAGSIVYPSAGLYQYDDIQAYIHKQLTATPVEREAANITILNGSGVSGLAATEQTKLEAAGYTVDGIDDAPSGTYPKYTVYQLNDDNPLTAAALAKLYGVKPVTDKTPPVAVTDTTDFVVVLGADAATSGSGN